MGDLTIRRIPDDEPDEVIVTPRTESVEYEITDKGGVVGRVDATTEAAPLSKEEIAQRVLLRKARELHMIRTILTKQKHDRIRAAEKKKAKGKNRKKNKLARLARKKNR